MTGVETGFDAVTENHLTQLTNKGMYEPSTEHDACGVGFVAQMRKQIGQRKAQHNAHQGNGECHTQGAQINGDMDALVFGLRAYVMTLGLWWAAWAMGVFLSAAGLRALIETVTLVLVMLLPGHATAARAHLQRLGHAALYLGLPAWLAWHASW